MTRKQPLPERSAAGKQGARGALPKASRPGSAKAAQPTPPAARGRAFPIVGIGASAGGLEAFTQLLSHLPRDPGLALVLVQHLDPTHDSALTELLARATKMRVFEVRDGMRIQPDHVYVIPPNSGMAVLQGRLSLVPRTKERGLHLPIDFFFRSLADEQRNRAVGVIMSGTASDGTEGLRAIKAEGGLTFAQDEKSAKYDDMPHSAIAAGVVDFVLPPEGIARELVRIARHPYLTLPPAVPAEETPPESAADLARVFVLLRAATGVDFSNYKPATIRRRIARRMLLHKIEAAADYARLLNQTPAEVDALYQDLLINVTSFFREPEAFEALKKKICPRWLKDRPPQVPLRIWVPGCSTGEEAYSLAICLLECLGKTPGSAPIQIFGTDISEPAIQKARQGIYPESITADVSPTRLRQFFVRHDAGYQVTKAIRDLCVFARQDVTKDPPFSRLDLISCRNLLIYLGGELQRRILPTFHYSLKSDGVLLLGGSETIGAAADLFVLLDRKHKLYGRKSAPHRMGFEQAFHSPPVERAAPGRPLPTAAAAGFDFQREADRVLLARYTPASVLVNDDLDILQFRGHTGAYLEPAAGAASFNLLKMAREGLLLELRSALAEARKRGLPVRRPGVRIQSPAGVLPVNLEVIPLPSPDRGRAGCFLILFAEPVPAAAPGPAPAGGKTAPAAPARPAAGERELARLQQELAATREYLQSVIEQHERTNQELQSANEEILSSNEELQSTNEELQTAKEELQSTNEELNTVNDELQTRNAELGQLNNDLVNLLNSAQISVVMLSGDLRIRRFTPAAEKVLNLIPGDVGRPLSDLRSNLVLPDLERQIAEVMETLTPREFEARDHDGHWFSIRVRPYKTLDQKIDGAILAVVDVDPLKRSLAEAREARAYAEGIAATVREPVLVLDAKLRVKTANQAFYELFQTRPGETEGRFIHSLGGNHWNLQPLRELLEDFLLQKARLRNFELTAEFPGVGGKRLLLTARRLAEDEHQPPLILLAMEEKLP